MLKSNIIHINSNKPLGCRVTAYCNGLPFDLCTKQPGTLQPCWNASSFLLEILITAEVDRVFTPKPGAQGYISPAVSDSLKERQWGGFHSLLG